MVCAETFANEERGNCAVVGNLTQKRLNIQYIEKYDNSIFYDVIRVQ